MNNSKTLSDTSNEKLVQLPLKGFHVEVESPKKGWKAMHEGMGDGRVRVHLVRIKK